MGCKTPDSLDWPRTKQLPFWSQIEIIHRNYFLSIKPFLLPSSRAAPAKAIQIIFILKIVISIKFQTDLNNAQIEQSCQDVVNISFFPKKELCRHRLWATNCHCLYNRFNIDDSYGLICLVNKLTRHLV